MAWGDPARGLGKWLVDSRISSRLVRLLDGRSENRMRELGMIAEVFEFQAISAVQGDYLEFGLWRGKTFSYAHRMKRRFKRKEMTLWGFDSFQGLPPIDDHRDNVWSLGEYACSEPEFREILARNGFSQDEYRLVPGYYQDSLNDEAHRQMQGRTAAIVYVDCDLYQSTVHVLDFVARYLADGSVVCFDDWHCYKSAPDQGEQRALKEFLEKNPRYQFLPWFDFCPVGKSFIVRVDPTR